MNKNAKKWLADLRSGKFRQGTNALASSDNSKHMKYCCLGVACERYQKDVGDLKIENEYGNRSYDDDEAVLPVKVAEWLGMKTDTGSLVYTSDEDEYTSLTEINDSGKFSFKQIADIIEENKEELFIEEE